VDGCWPRESLLEEKRRKTSRVVGSSQTSMPRRDSEPDGGRGASRAPALKISRAGARTRPGPCGPARGVSARSRTPPSPARSGTCASHH